ncbi:MAG TPA: FHA domain-containing protein [Kiritimatiellia bacterium]|nr:FHA domain-containing protein [Kiritimatiellia bacterium]
MYRLLFLNGKFKGKRLSIQQGSLTIGRDPECNIDLEDDDEVSRHHATIEYREGGPVIRDLGATNPVLVNQQPVKEHRLRDGDQIEIGRTIIEFHYGTSSKPPQQRRRFSKMQAASFAAIGVIILLQLIFVIVFPLWQKSETVPVVIPDEVPAVVEAPKPVEQMQPAPEPQFTGPTPAPLPVSPEPAPAPVVAVKDSAPEPKVETPVDMPPAVVRETAIIDPLESQAIALLAEAKVEIGRRNYSQADSMLNRIQLIVPDYVPAWTERAKLYETRKLYFQAGGQWEKVMELTKGTPEFDVASRERARMNELERARAVASREPTTRPLPEVTAPSRILRIASVDRERFQATDEFDDMRLVRVTIRPRTGEGAIKSDQVQVIVTFYDRVEGTDIIMPSRAQAQVDATRITGPWPAGESRTVAAAYVLRKGFRAEERAAVRERRVYEGYRVALYYNGVLQEEVAMPRRILDLPRPPISGIP